MVRLAQLSYALIARPPRWRLSALSRYRRALSTGLTGAHQPSLLPLSVNMPEILRIAASPHQKRMLRLLENDNSWSRFLAWCPSCFRSEFESLRLGYLQKFSQGQDPELGPGNKKGEKKTNPDEEGLVEESKKMPKGPKILLLLFLMYILHNLSTNDNRIIPWEKFVDEYLLRGEVDYVRMRPGSGYLNVIVNVRMQDGSYRRQVFLVAGEKGRTFEESLRLVEDQMSLPMEERLEVKHATLVNPTSVLTTVVTILAGVFVIRFLLQTLSRNQGGKNAGKGGKDSSPSSSSSFSAQIGSMFDPTMGMTRIRSALSSSNEMQQATQGITFKDVAGLHGAKIEVVEFVDYLKRPERFLRLGAKLPRGALLVGPPGCGKTLLVKALANEAEVPFFFMAGSEFMEVISGVGASRMRQLFKEARNAAPAIIFIDEIDTIGRTRADGNSETGGTSEMDQTLNQLLVEMDGMGTEAGVVIFAATNRSDVLDKALMRPGRFDRLITIDLPSQAERKEMFELHLSKIKIQDPISGLAGKLSAQTPGMTGADIANVVNEAALSAVRMDCSTVTTRHFEESLHRVIAGATKRNRVLNLMERERIAAHEAGHAVVSWMLKYTEPLLRVSIVPRVASPLGYSQSAKQDKFMYNQDELFDRMCMLLGGRVAENFYYSNLSSGAEDDLKSVTDLAYKQIRQFGMNERVGHLSFNYNSDDPYAISPYSKNLKKIMDEEAQNLIQKAYQTTKEVVEKYWNQVDKVRSALLSKESLSYEELEDLMGPRPEGRKLAKEDWRFEA